MERYVRLAHSFARHQVDELELADLDLVARGELRLVDPLPVHVRAVQRAHVPDEYGPAVAA